MNKIMLFVISNIVGIVLYLILKKIFAPDPHKNYSKSYDFCLRVTKCKDHALPITKKQKTGIDDDTTAEINILDHENLVTLQKTSKNMCNKTKGTQTYRHKYKCFHNETGNSISDCTDCGSPKNIKVEGKTVRKCSKAGHDLLYDGTLPTFDQCLNITGYSKYDKKPSPLELYDNYNISVTEGTNLDDNWWEKKDYLFKCIMGEGNYINSRYDSPQKKGENSSKEDEGDGVNSINRFINCTHCSNISNNKADFDKCYKISSHCFGTEYTGTDCEEYFQKFIKYINK